MVRLGSYIHITSDNENYDEYRTGVWKVTHIARNKSEHQGYDEGVGGTLIDCDGLPFSLYEWEYEIVPRPKPKKEYQIYQAHTWELKQFGDSAWMLEKFQTGGWKFSSYKAAHDMRKNLQKMTKSFKYKVMPVN